MQFLDEQDSLVGRVEDYRVGGWYSVIKLVRPGASICSVLMWWIHSVIDVLDWPHVDMVW